MAFKFVIFASCVAVACAGVITPAIPAVAKVAAPVAVAKAVVDTDFDPNPQYSYSYDIQDALTGDSKGQQETRHGDVVRGSYTLVEPDGTRRTVEYTADPVNGFNAVVHREPLYQKTVVATKISAPLAYSTPIVKAYATPISKVVSSLSYTAAPVAKTLIH